MCGQVAMKHDMRMMERGVAVVMGHGAPTCTRRSEFSKEMAPRDEAAGMFVLIGPAVVVVPTNDRRRGVEAIKNPGPCLVSCRTSTGTV